MLGILLLFAAVLGGAFGSFAGVVASRGWNASLGGRSRCDRCGRRLAWYELVPFLSYAALRGRCRTCRERIGWAAFLWEVGGGLVAVAVVLAIVLVTGAGS